MGILDFFSKKKRSDQQVQKDTATDHAVNVSDSPDGKVPNMLTFRVSWTGITLYHLYCRNQLLCTASTYPMPFPSVSFCSSSGKNWHWEQRERVANPENYSYGIINQKTKRIDFKIDRINSQFYILRKEGLLHFREEIEIRADKDRYTFSCGNCVAAVIFHNDFRCTSFPDDLPEEAELRYGIWACEGIDPDILALVNAFPLFR